MDRIDAAVTPSVAEPATATASRTGLGDTFRAVAQGTTVESRRRSLRGAARAGRRLTPDASASTDSGTWRLAL
ncbi:MAG: hypothetical protein ACLGIC_05670 [Acidimicrobiia bacterium]